ncbi:MAG TPA: hypothetical protein VHK28_06260, partial [Candidatus Limnocylindria bacterium]|nr:hypothetical protein [Candidatus Limnocylindria bacterium]
DALGQDVPSDEERAGLGNIGEYRDAAASGQAGAEADSLAEEGLDRLGDGDLGASQPIGAEEHASRVATTGGLDAGEASREGPGTTRDGQTNSPGTG